MASGSGAWLVSVMWSIRERAAYSDGWRFRHTVSGLSMWQQISDCRAAGVLSCFQSIGIGGFQFADNMAI
jgi:hypothetical protein